MKPVKDQNILHDDRQKLHQLTVLWGMRFNPSKCQNYAPIKEQKEDKVLCELCNEILISVDHVKYLGIILVDDLSWHRHACEPAKKANSTLHLITSNHRSCFRTARIVAYTIQHNLYVQRSRTST